MEIITKIEELMDSIPLDEYWFGFKPVAYAIYNFEEVYLFNHPFTDYKTITIPREPVFNGADTLVLFHDYPTAIVNMDHHATIDTLYPILVHELFHGFQYLYGEKRFPDELFGSQYPLKAENILLRSLEREQLYSAVQHNSADAISRFISLREKRKAIIDKYTDYEFLIESVEGTAWYIEFLAQLKITGQSRAELLKTISGPLLDKFESNLNIRASAYRSGLFICLYLDLTVPGWKLEFIESELTLYELLKKNVHWSRTSFNNWPQVTEEALELVEYINSKREERFDEFLEQGEYVLFIEGNFGSFNFDPINMVTYETKTLHPAYLRVAAGTKELIFTQPVISYFKEKLSDIYRLELRLKNKPEVKNGTIIFEKMGELSGDISVEGSIFTLKI
jgi:hypothetical protein